jgi:hypothetical protein
MKTILGFLVAVLAVGVVAWAQGNVNPSDMVQAKSFVSSLPAACGSNIGTRGDGSVGISYSCPGKDGGVAIGNIYIKDGKITELI